VEKMENTLQKTEPETQAASPMVMAANLCKAGEIAPAQLKELLDVQLAWEANEAKKAYNQAMTAFKANPPEILKNRHVEYTTAKGITEYDHATLNNVTTIISKALSNYGLTASWITSQTEKGITVTCKITHVLGHSEETSLTAGPDTSGGKNSIQAIGSTVSYLRRYTLEAITGIASKDIEDDDGQAGGEKLRPKPSELSEKNIETLTAIEAALAPSVSKGRKIDRKKHQILWLSERGHYPGIPSKAKQAAEWILSLNCEDRWTIADADAKPYPTPQQILDQAFLEFEAKHQEYLADFDGKKTFCKARFTKAVKDKFGGMPTHTESIAKIVNEISPEKVTALVKDGTDAKQTAKS
jgi:hypothetical protein